MLRSLLCAVAILSIALSLFLLPPTASARRCPVKDPETLLALYQNSDAIYVATFDKITEGEVVDTNDDYSVQKIQKHFTISTTLKGQSRKFFVLNDQKYDYKSVAVGPEPAAVEEPATADEPEVAEEPEYEEEEDSDELKSGDTLLLFIKNGNGEEGPALTDYSDGIKKLSMEKIGVYEARIKDLNSIFASKKVSETQLLEWLIRCAQDPITRWEGTFELLQSVQTQERREQAAERLRERRQAHGEPAEPEAEVEAPEESHQTNFDTSVFAKMLDINHKQTLANTLLNDHDSSAKGSERPQPVAGDRELIELVKRWGDPRLIGFLIDKLRAGSDDASLNSETMSMVAEILGDDEAAEIAQKYEENAYEDDGEIVEAESADAEQEEPASVEFEPGETVEVEPVPEGDRTAEPAAENDAGSGDEKPEVKKQTYKELRTELMQKFLTQYDKVVAQREKEKESKSAR